MHRLSCKDRTIKRHEIMEVINFDEHPSLVSRYMEELRDVTVQNDPLRFRMNLMV